MDKKENRGLVLSKPQNVLPIDVVNDREAAMLIFKDLIASGKMNVKTPSEALAMYIKSQELGLPFITATDHMHMINGKAGVDIHVLRAMVLTAGGIYWETIQDYQPLYEYKDNTGATIAIGYSDDCLPDSFDIPKGKDPDELKHSAINIKNKGNIPVFKSISYVDMGDNIKRINYGTIIKFERIITMSDNTKRTIVEYGKFTTKDMVVAGLHLRKNGEVNYSSPHLLYENVLQEHRSWTFGARKIAADILMGLYEIKELYDMTDVKYNVDDTGSATLID